ncbi:MAG: hypothetical protein GX962_07040, partial [Epulopiscium sp.]|nr:hypothetical protein [Candidatus Epulonipiscium sp.]
MKRKVSVLLLIAMIMQLIPNIGWVQNVYANIEPDIFNIRIEQVQNTKKETSLKVIFRGIGLRKIQAIVIKEESSGKALNSISSENLRVVNDEEIIAENIESLSLLLNGGFDRDLVFDLYYTDGNKTENKDSSNTFKIPEENFPEVSNIKLGEDLINPPDWPAHVIQKQGHEFEFLGNNFQVDYKLGFQEGTAAVTMLEHLTDYEIGSNGTSIKVKADSNRISPGINKKMILEKRVNTTVTMRYVLENAVNIIKPLDIGDPSKVQISPLEGTQGTLVRIKVEKDTELVNLQTKVYIGGMEAKRNIVEAEGLDGTFTYKDGSTDRKGLEVIVPKLEAGSKQIIIQNYLGDTYIHNETFEYFDADYPRLKVEGMNPSSGPVGRRNDIDYITIRNSLAIHNLKEVSDKTKTRVAIVDESKLKYPKFKEEAEKNRNLLFVRYELEDGRSIERRISLTIGLPAEIKEMKGIPSGEFEISTLPSTVDISATTAAVGTPGPTVVRIRTETVLLDKESNDYKELEYVAEQAPYVVAESAYYTFIADETTPVINNIIPKQGPYDKDIVVTIEGQNFDVRHIDGRTYYPTVIIGKSGQYKVINKDGMFFSTTSDGNYDVADKFDDTNAIEMTVLDQNGNIVDGQIRKKGTRIKLTIPGDHIRGYYTGAADVFIRNSTVTGELGSVGSRDNFFEYLPKANINPEIETVVPDQVAVGSKERVTITGRNFQPNLIVTVDGEIIPNPVINPAAG